MKIGNISQTIVPVPNFFLNQSTRKLDTFASSTTRNKKSLYYRDKDLFTKNLDININHNPRFDFRTSQKTNKSKYIPLYHRGDYPSNSAEKDTYFPHIIDNSIKRTFSPSNEYEKYKDYMAKTNTTEILRPKLREEIMNNTQNLLDRINANYDIDKWTEFENKTTFNKFYQTAYSPITDYIRQNESFKDQFNRTLVDKARTLRTLNPQAKKEVTKTVNRIEAEKNNEVIDTKDNELILDEMLETCKSNLLKLKHENQSPFEYNEKDQKFVTENEYVMERFKDTTMYKKFPAPTRMEFDEKKIRAKKKRFKITDNPNHVSKEKYSFKENELYTCQNEMWSRPLHKDHF